MNINLNLSPVTYPLMQPFNRLATSELTKKVLLIALPLILLLLLVRKVFKNRATHIRNVEQPVRPVENRPLIMVATECDRVRRQIIATINETKEISQLHSAKIFINIECNNRRFSRDSIIRELDTSPLPKTHLGMAVCPIINEAKDFLGIEHPDRFTSKWIALLKDREGVFHQADGSIECSHINGEYRISDPTSIGRSIDPNHLQEYFNLVLGRMVRENTPQLDGQRNFI
jgi:hypothetical protein